MHAPGTTQAESQVTANSEITARLSGSPCVLLLDIDGTLAPIAPRPSEARIPDATRAVIKGLAARPDMKVALVSGRSAADARKMAGLDDAAIWIIGNHGIETSDPGGAIAVHPDILSYSSAVSAAAVRTDAIAREVPGVVVEDKRWTLSVHYRLADDAVVPELIGAVADVASEFGLRMTRGKRVIELRPPVPVDKGSTVAGLAEGATAAAFAGDDEGDLAAFAALRMLAATGGVAAAVTIGVASDESPAEVVAQDVVVDGPVGLAELLSQLADVLSVPG